MSSQRHCLSHSALCPADFFFSLIFDDAMRAVSTETRLRRLPARGRRPICPGLGARRGAACGQVGPACRAEPLRPPVAIRLSKRGFFCPSPVRANCAGGGAGEAGGTPQGCPFLDRSVIHRPFLVATLKTFKVKKPRARVTPVDNALDAALALGSKISSVGDITNGVWVI